MSVSVSQLFTQIVSFVDVFVSLWTFCLLTWSSLLADDVITGLLSF